MGKRLRKARSMCCCVSPRSSYLTPHSIFSWYEEDVWTEIAKFLDGRSLVMLAMTCKWFNRIMMEDSVWKYACLRDLQVPDTGKLVRCPVCDLDTCDGTMQTLDARHIELFLNEGYHDGSWDYDTLGSHDIKKQAEGASGGIFDVEHLKDQSTSDIFDLKSWVGKRNDWQPKAMITLHAVAVNTNLQDNEGLQVKYHAMRAGKDGEVVSIRISQQLL
ncbi:UNVERIFIED_CONTAM: putative F-box protein [Sesamum angustifolium]|uniref:F-box protein n=1 Tax=Sesamum angustifolium TaxID=2727405 RepID=A0AAW2RGW1_9LAMI